MTQPGKDPSGAVLELTVRENLLGREDPKLEEALRSAIQASGKVRVLLRMEGFRHLDPEGMLQQLSFLKPHLSDIPRVAVVGNRVWIKSWVQMAGVFFGSTEVRYFDMKEAKDARQWVAGREG